MLRTKVRCEYKIVKETTKWTSGDIVKYRVYGRDYIKILWIKLPITKWRSYLIYDDLGDAKRIVQNLTVETIKERVA